MQAKSAVAPTVSTFDIATSSASPPRSPLKNDRALRTRLDLRQSTDATEKSYAITETDLLCALSRRARRCVKDECRCPLLVHSGHQDLRSASGFNPIRSPRLKFEPAPRHEV